MFTFTPLQGARSESSAVQSILELDGGIKVLIDVGWDESFDVEKLKELEKQIPTLSLVLLTHATISHLGAYAHCCKHLPLFTRIPVYATTPVIALGRTSLQELYASTPLAATTIPKSSLNELSQATSAESNILLQPPTHEEIATYFSLIHPLKYSQPHQPLSSPFSPPLNGLTITAHNSGSTLGGTMWHIQHGLESIVYAVDWNQGRENVYAGAAWLGGAGGGGAEVIEQLRKPTALICSSKGARKPPLAKAKRDEPLLETVQACVANGGVVLIPVDSSARVLELAYLMEHAWRQDAASKGSLHASKLYLAGRSIHSTMRYARSMLEWMDERIVQEFEDVADLSKRGNGVTDGTAQGKQGGPFDFKFLKLLDRKGQIDKVLAPNSDGSTSGGKVILASDSSLEWGFSKDVFTVLVQDPKNLLILTGLPAPPSDGNSALASTFYRWWRDAVVEKEKQGAEATRTGIGADGVLVQVAGRGREAEVRNVQKLPLEGDDLRVYRLWLAQQRQLQDTLQTGGATALESSLDVDDVSSESSSDSDDSETHQQGKALNVSTTLGRTTRKKTALADEDLGPNILLKKKAVYDYDVRGKSGRDAMFPHPVQRRRADDYGEFIRVEDFVKAEERQDDGQNGDQAGKGDVQANIGRKRKWTDSAPNKGQGSSDKRPRLERNASAEYETAIVDGPPQNELDDVPDDEEELVTGPYKLAITRENVSINFNIAFIDFSGIHDKRSLHMLIPLIQPRKLILTGGNPEETDELAADLPQLLQNIDIHKPDMGSSVDASADTNAYTIKIAPTLYKGLKWQSVGNVKIATIFGRLEPGSDGTPILDIATVIATGMTAGHHSVKPFHVGELRLANLRKDLRDIGYSTEFMGEGTLLVQNSVIVRKAATSGRIEVESSGWDTSTVQTVRKMIYDKLAVVG
ncbi:cleavage and polyadenylation specificity factor subunit 2 [Pseudomassariella vexata]|uniref:Cleavage and polyadenylation specificity factor subunit 2 n=1 Tax=Pseudomassariella vexata TaxID=1141098 RepID=A0A1Y2DQ40_9PEZI|nr:cleavage and polyadenylation specificity factor subunit 2 [Pseudomassariella vexata]ORY60775.1 cleavage and polyadenylation specificity factor subunit 2 [Pseudomassariella vexata]